MSTATDQPPVAGTSQSPGPDSKPAVDNASNGAATTATAGADSEMADGTQPPEEEEVPADANEVLYINNLNERIKLKGERALHCPPSSTDADTRPSHTVMKQSLKVLFKEYGAVLDVTAHSNIRMRGQAFVTLNSKQAAAKAVKEVKGFPLYGKPMVSNQAHVDLGNLG